jgi:hypothetical protein
MSDNEYKEFTPVRQGVDRDWPGPQPRQSYAVGEKEAFNRVRSELDRALQISGVAPSQPQEGHRDPRDYERSLLRELAFHTKQYSALKNPTSPVFKAPGLLDRYKGEILAEVMTEPHRQNRLAEIKSVDRTGRTIHEYVGPKRLWMSDFRAVPMVSADGAVIHGGDSANSMMPFTRIPG